MSNIEKSENIPQTELRRELMYDIIQKHAKMCAQDNIGDITNPKIKRQILDQFMEIAQAPERAAYRYFNQCVNSAEARDTLQMELMLLREVNYDLMGQYQELCSLSDRDQDKIKALDGKAAVAKNLADCIAKSQMHQVNLGKNDILIAKHNAENELANKALDLEYNTMPLKELKHLLASALKEKDTRDVMQFLTDESYREAAGDNFDQLDFKVEVKYDEQT